MGEGARGTGDRTDRNASAGFQADVKGLPGTSFKTFWACPLAADKAPKGAVLISPGGSRGERGLPVNREASLVSRLKCCVWGEAALVQDA
jgi:hypothetical protein